MAKYNFDDILVFAVNIEKNGEKFYKEQAAKFNDNEIKELFLFLANEEKRHKFYFQEILDSVQTFSQDEGQYNDEYFAYFRAFVDNSIFNSEKSLNRISKIDSIYEALDFALQMESDSIMFYSELKTFVSDNEKGKIDIIIDEEKKHFRRLYEVKKKLISSMTQN